MQFIFFSKSSFDFCFQSFLIAIGTIVMSTFSTGIDSQSFQVIIPLLSSKQSARVTSNVQQRLTNVCAVPERWSSRRGWYPLQVRNFSPDILPRSHVFCNVIPQLESSKPGEGVRNQITCVSSHRLHHIFFLTDHFQKTIINQMEHWCWLGKYMGENPQRVARRHHIL